jgi:S1-C subfamily serine protease
MPFVDGDPRTYGFLGVRYDDGTPPLVIRYVVPRSGAANAGVQVGDRIVWLRDLHLPDSAKIKDMVRVARPGEWVRLVVERDGAEIEMHVRLISIRELIELDKR